MQEGQLDLETPGYYQYWNYAERKGYSGTPFYEENRFRCPMAWGSRSTTKRAA